MRKNVKDKVKGAAQFFQQADTSTNVEINIETKPKIEPTIESKIASSASTECASTTETISSTSGEVSINVSTNISGIPKKARYLETRVQRSYYLDKELVKELDKFAKKNDYDKSDIINHILKEFLYKNGKI